MTMYEITPQSGLPWKVSEDRLLAVVRGFTGRNALSIPSVRRRLRETGRVYIAGRTRGNGVTIQRIS